MPARNNLQIEWCRDSDQAHELATFFVANIDANYISHSELQGPRALDLGQWSPDILELTTIEIAARTLPCSLDDGTPILTARLNEKLVGLSFVSFFPDAPVPYGMVEDIVVGDGARGSGVGKQIMDWISLEALKVGCARLFLESGIGNDDAHHFFEHDGFKTCSIVMMKKLKKS